MEQTDTVKKREDYLSWNDYFMSIALLSSQRSKDPQLQEGACLVNKENQVVGIGYNGMPVGCNDDEMPWADKADDVLETKHPYICHAVLNAVMNKISAVVKDCRLFSTHYPCSHCAGLIIQAGIKEVYYLYDNPDTITSSATARLFHICNVSCERYTSKVASVTIDLGVKEKSEEKEA
ncbi:deoxycytidylate deaminase [Trichuris trichiura]|uniref:Probable deoxycytidylate deaminase n=1 Tax=Trichuris trichiura TaxID=36087 RepID=A0A077YXK7_TRITR|nr:deoxycytidylate deaminase [Trichuris trichiura]